MAVLGCVPVRPSRPLLHLPAREGDHLGSRFDIRAVHAVGERPAISEVPEAPGDGLPRLERLAARPYKVTLFFLRLA